MNNLDPVGGLPPQIPTHAHPGFVPLGETPEDREPITGPISTVDAILRHPRRVMWQLRQPGASRVMFFVVVVAAVCAVV
jgi:hypothetical protein